MVFARDLPSTAVRKASVVTLQTNHRKVNRKCLQVKRSETDGSYEVHEYERADGTVGWVLYSYATKDGVHYVKVEQEGPETWREHDWQEIVQDDIRAPVKTLSR